MTPKPGGAGLVQSRADLSKIFLAGDVWFTRANLALDWFAMASKSDWTKAVSRRLARQSAKLRRRDVTVWRSIWRVDCCSRT
jgi:hypothetical protein